MAKYIAAVVCVLVLVGYGQASPAEKSAGKVVRSAVQDRQAVLQAIES